TDALALTAGLRYAHNRQYINDATYGSVYGAAYLTPANYAGSFASTPSEGVVTWAVSPQWHIDQNSMVYARVATGYRPGGSTGQVLPASPTYSSDTLTNYEVGYKGDFLDQRLTLTVALYDIEWNNIQVNITDTVHDLVYPGNGKTARSRGGEASASYK